MDETIYFNRHHCLDPGDCFALYRCVRSEGTGRRAEHVFYHTSSANDRFDADGFGDGDGGLGDAIDHAKPVCRANDDRNDRVVGVRTALGLFSVSVA